MIRNKKGFTLIELFVLIAIIAILFSIAINSYRFSSSVENEVVIEKRVERVVEDKFDNSQGVY